MNLDQEFFGNPLSRWLIAAGVALLSMLALRLLKGLARRRLEPLVKRTDVRIDDALVETIEDTRWWFYISVALWSVMEVVVLRDEAERAVRSAAVLLLLSQAAVWAQSFVKYASSAWIELDEDGQPRRRTAAAAATFLVRLATWSLVIVVALGNLGIEISGLITGLGIGGVAAALAVQNVLGDLFASLSIYFDRPFDLGDFIIVGTDMGTVERIGMRSTRITALGGQQIIFANSDLAQARVHNYRRMNERRVVTQVGVTYETSAAQLREIPELLRRAVENAEDTRFERAHFKAFGDFALQFELVWTMLDPDYNLMMDRQQQILLEVYDALEELGARIAFPTQTIHLERAAE